ncbi:MAG: BamA/TamA family outer membrane protein [candidate division WOR-3 bacterium]|nr:BamA/TamA family outer membrane protein [candidate division WOR-3 bacterium]
MILAGWAVSAPAGPLVITRVEILVSPPNRNLNLAPGISAGDSLGWDDLSRAEARVTEQLAAEGYLSAGVEADTTIRDDSLVVRFRVQTGKPARVGGWRIAGDDSLPVEGLLRLLPGKGARFSRAMADHGAAAILRVHENSGYPFAVVTPLALAQESGFVYPALQVAAGPKVEIGFLEFAGRPGTKPELLKRVAGFSRRGYSHTVVAQWRQRLEQSGLVMVDSEAIVRALGTVPVGEPRGQSPRSAYGVRFWVTGGRNNRASGVAGYSPEDHQLTGLVHIAFHNLFDTGRRLEADWRSAFARTSYRLSYTEPWVLGTPIDVTASAQQQTVDTTSAQTNLALAAQARAAAWTTVSFETGYDRFTDAPSEASAAVVWAGTGVVVDSRDFPANPRSGVRLSVLTKVGNRAVDSTHSDVVTHIELGLAGVLPLGPSVAWSNSVGGRAVYSAATLTEPELYRMGGPGTVRGYREDEFVSTRLGWFTSEVRYLLGRTSSAYPFLDVGVYQDLSGWQVKPGYGVGTRVATPVGVLGLDYGVAFRDSPLRGKVHLSYDVTF